LVYDGGMVEICLLEINFANDHWSQHE